MLLEVNVEKKFPDFDCRIRFSLKHRQCGIFGPSGSGKSTLMHMLAGLLSPDRGYIRLNGRTLFDSETGTNLAADVRRIGVVFQTSLLFPHMNVHKNLYYGMHRIPAHERTIQPEDLISFLQLNHLLDRSVNNLSGGERKRVALGRSILACPHLLLLDEPLNGLDDELKFQIIEYLRNVFDHFSTPLLFISHDSHEMFLMTEHVLVLNNGRVTRQVAPESLARSPPERLSRLQPIITHEPDPGTEGNIIP